MCKNIKKVLSGNDEMASYYQQAKLLWDKIDISDDEKLMKVLKDKQLDFEHACGGRDMGQKIMVCYGIMQFLKGDNINRESAKKVAHAFRNNCNEIKVLVKEISHKYNL